MEKLVAFYTDHAGVYYSVSAYQPRPNYYYSVSLATKKKRFKSKRIVALNGTFSSIRVLKYFFPKTSSNRNDQSESEIHLEMGDILKTSAEVIVSTVTKNLDLNCGVLSKTILKATGEFLLTELRVNYPRGIDSNKIAITSGGNLSNVRAIFHVALMSRYENSSDKEDLIGLVISKCLKKLVKQNLNSIAIPSIGCGNLGYKASFVAKSMLESIFSFLMQNSKKKLVIRIVIFEKEVDIFQVLTIFKYKLSLIVLHIFYYWISLKHLFINCHLVKIWS